MLTQSERRRGLNIAVCEASAAAVHTVLVSGALLTGFALAWGANDFQLGVLGAIPFLGAMFQIAGAYVTDRWPDRRKLSVAWTGLISRSSWFLIAVLPFVCGGSSSPGMNWIIVLYFFYQATMNASGPGWVAWLAVLVPARVRGRFLGRRYRFMEGFNIATLLLAGAAIDAFRNHGLEREGFAILQACAGMAGLLCFVFLIRQPDPGHTVAPPELHLRYILAPLRDRKFRRLVVFNLCWFVGMTVSTPFLNAHLLKNMEWNFKSLAVLGILISVTSILMYPVWGRLADRHGCKPVLILCSAGLLHLPLYYIFCPWDVHWPIYLCNLLSGLFVSGFNLAMFSLTLEGLPPKGRAMGSAVLAAAAGPAVFLSGAAAGWLAELLTDVRWQIGGVPVTNYQLLFAISILMRLPTFFLISRIEESGAHKVLDLFRGSPLRHPKAAKK